MHRWALIAATLFLAACGGGDNDGAMASDSTAAPVGQRSITTRMTCIDREAKRPSWWALVTIDPAEHPWRSMSVISQYPSYFVSDPQGDIVNVRGLAIQPPPGSNDVTARRYIAQTFLVTDDVFMVVIASNVDMQLDFFTFNADGSMIELLQVEQESRPEMICTPFGAGQPDSGGG